MRVNIFCSVYKGLRALLYDAALTLQQTDFSEADEAEAALNRISEAVLLFKEQERHENRFILPAVFEYEPSVADAFRQEQEKGFLLCRRLCAAVISMRQAPTQTEQQKCEQKITAAFVDFLVFALEHLAHKEKVLNEILWRYYNDACLQTLQQMIAQSRTPQDNAAYSKWMIRGISNSEIVRWMKAFEQSAPEDVFQTLFATAERELPEPRLRKVLEALTEGMMLP